MIVGNKNRLGLITVELAVSLVLIAVVIFVTLGLFSDNLKDMVSNGNFKNVFSKDDSTFFSKSSMDYASSQITVQVMGEQGLRQLRRKANNNAIPLIENPFDDTNSNGNQIGYLVTIINGIVGDPDICVQMSKESDKKCSEDGIGGYKYEIGMSSYAITITKVDINRIPDPNFAPISVKLESSVASILSGAPKSVSSFDTPAVSPGGTVNKDSSADKYMNAMKNLGDSLKSYGVTSILFGNSINVFKSQARLIADIPTVTTPPVNISLGSPQLIVILNLAKDNAIDANLDCKTSKDRGYNNCSPDYINSNDLELIKTWVVAKITQLASFNGTEQAKLNIIANDSQACSVSTKMGYDQIFNTKATFLNGLSTFATQNNLTFNRNLCQ